MELRAGAHGARPAVVRRFQPAGIAAGSAGRAARASTAIVRPGPGGAVAEQRGARRAGSAGAEAARAPADGAAAREGLVMRLQSAILVIAFVLSDAGAQDTVRPPASSGIAARAQLNA